MIHSRLFCPIRFVLVSAFGAAGTTTTTCGMQFALYLCVCVRGAQMSKLTFHFGRDFKSDFKERTVTGERKKLTSNSLHLSFSSTSRYKWHFTVGLLCHNLSESYKELEYLKLVPLKDYLLLSVCQ